MDTREDCLSVPVGSPMPSVRTPRRRRARDGLRVPHRPPTVPDAGPDPADDDPSRAWVRSTRWAR